MGRVKWFFLDDLSEGLTTEDVVRAFTKKGRFLKLVYFIEKNVNMIDTMRPLFELHGFKNSMPHLAADQYPGYDDYLFIVFNSSIPHLLYNEPNRSLAQKMYRSVLRSFKIVTDHFVIYDGELRDPAMINRWEFVSLLTNNKFYKEKPYKDLNSFISVNCPEDHTCVSENPAHVILQELSFKTLSSV